MNSNFKSSFIKVKHNFNMYSKPVKRSFEIYLDTEFLMDRYYYLLNYLNDVIAKDSKVNEIYVKHVNRNLYNLREQIKTNSYSDKNIMKAFDKIEEQFETYKLNSTQKKLLLNYSQNLLSKNELKFQNKFKY